MPGADLPGEETNGLLQCAVLNSPTSTYSRFSFPAKRTHRRGSPFQEFMFVLGFSNVYGHSKRQQTDQRHRQHFTLRQNPIQVFKVSRHKFYFGLPLREVIEPAAKRRNRISSPSRTLREQNQGFRLAHHLCEPVGHRASCCPSLLPVSCLRRSPATNQDSAKDFLREVRSHAIIPVVLRCHWSRLRANLARQRRPHHHDIQVARVIRKVNPLFLFPPAPCPAHLHATDPARYRRDHARQGMHARAHSFETFTESSCKAPRALLTIVITSRRIIAKRTTGIARSMRTRNPSSNPISPKRNARSLFPSGPS